MVDNVLPRVQFRQWVISMPKRVRWHLREKPEVVSGLLGVFLRAVETTVRQNSPDAPSGSRFGAVAFVHRFGSYLNSHVHFHILVTDGVFSTDDDGEAVFHPAVDLDAADFLAVQTKMRHRGLRWLHRHGHLDSEAVHTLDAPDHAGGWDESMTRCWFVAVMQATEDHLGLDVTHHGRLNRPRYRTVFLQTQVSPTPVVVAHVFSKHSLEMPFIEDDNMVEAFTPN